MFVCLFVYSVVACVVNRIRDVIEMSEGLFLTRRFYATLSAWFAYVDGFGSRRLQASLQLLLFFVSEAVWGLLVAYLG